MSKPSVVGLQSLLSDLSSSNKILLQVEINPAGCREGLNLCEMKTFKLLKNSWVNVNNPGVPNIWSIAEKMRHVVSILHWRFHFVKSKFINAENKGFISSDSFVRNNSLCQVNFCHRHCLLREIWHNILCYISLCYAEVKPHL